MASPEQDSPELTRFREEWNSEVRSRIKHELENKPSTSVLSSNINEEAVVPSLPHVIRTSTSLRSPPHISDSSVVKSRALQMALSTYKLAVQAEQRGDLDDALQLYKQAFKSNRNVDKAYNKEEMTLASFVAPQAKPNINTSKERLIIPDATLPHKSKSTSLAPSLAELVSNYPSDVAFEAEDIKNGIPISLIPDELMILILRLLDPFSLETFAKVGRKARILSLDPIIWQDFVIKTYIPPQISLENSLDDIVFKYDFNYRRLFIEQPRVRLDGVYIAVCHYVRRGLSENAWVNITHLITYHRYLRFFADGQVLSLLANEEVEPQSIVPQLKLTLRMKGLFKGRWALKGNTVTAVDLKDSYGSTTRYTFQMTLNLHSRPLGRWNKLNITEYDSVDRDSGEATPLALKNERPFWFSKVRSYT